MNFFRQGIRLRHRRGHSGGASPVETAVQRGRGRVFVGSEVHRRQRPAAGLPRHHRRLHHEEHQAGKCSAAANGHHHGRPIHRFIL